MNPNLFSAEQPTLDHLKADLVPLFPDITVDSASLVAGSYDPAEYAPGVFMFAGSGTVKTDAMKHTVTAETQTWQFSALVAHHAGASSSSAHRAGEILAAVFDSLLGWKPTDNHTPLKLTGRGDPYYEPGFVEFPVFFETTLVQKRS